MNMSSDNIAIRVNNLSKRYEIYANPRDRLKQFVLPRLRRLAGQSPSQYFRIGVGDAAGDGRTRYQFSGALSGHA